MGDQYHQRNVLHGPKAPASRQEVSDGRHGARETITPETHAVRVYDNGVRVGCTWVTPEALRNILAKVNELHPELL